MVGEIETKQTLSYENVLHFRKKIRSSEMEFYQQKITNLQFVEGVQQVGPAVSVTYEIELVDGQEVVDIEIFIPIDKPISISGEFDYIPKFNIRNALKVRVVGDISQLELAVKKISEYIQLNCLIQTTPVCVVGVRGSTDVTVDDSITDIYVGIQQ